MTADEQQRVATLQKKTDKTPEEVTEMQTLLNTATAEDVTAIKALVDPARIEAVTPPEE